MPHGIFNGQKHCSKPMEDAAGYQWLPVIHTMIYGLAEDDLTFFEEGHARRAAEVAMMVMDNAGYGAAFGDCSGLTSGAGVGARVASRCLVLSRSRVCLGRRADGTRRGLLRGPHLRFPHQVHSTAGPRRPASLHGPAAIVRVCQEWFQGTGPEHSQRPGIRQADPPRRMESRRRVSTSGRLWPGQSHALRRQRDYQLRGRRLAFAGRWRVHQEHAPSTTTAWW